MPKHFKVLEIGVIVERKRREGQIFNHQVLLDRVGDMAGIGAWEFDIVRNELFWSTKTYDIHGVAPDFKPTLEAAIGFYAPEAQKAIGDAVQAARANGEPWNLELSLIRADGRPIWVCAMGAAVFENGTVVRLNGALQDITARIAERQKLRDANERLHLATDAGGVGIWDWDVATNQLTWDAQMHELYGTCAREGAETVELWTSRLHPDDREAAELALNDSNCSTHP